MTLQQVIDTLQEKTSLTIYAVSVGAEGIANPTNIPSYGTVLCPQGCPTKGVPTLAFETLMCRGTQGVQLQFPAAAFNKKQVGPSKIVCVFCVSQGWVFLAGVRLHITSTSFAVCTRFLLDARCYL